MATVPHILPARVRFRETELTRWRIEGIVPLSRLARLSSVSLEPTDAQPVSVCLYGRRADDGGAMLEGTLCGDLALRCVRCLESIRWVIDLSVRLRVVRSETEERRLLDQCEPLWLEDDWLPLHALIEDEILLELPMAPKHPEGSCPSPRQND